MQCVLEDLLGQEAIQVESKNGQEYFDQFLEITRSALKSAEDSSAFCEDQPKGYLLLQLTGEVT